MGAGLIWSSYLIFSGNESALYCLQECGRGKARLTEGESFNVWELYKRKWVLLLSKGLKEMRRGISSPKSAGKRWDLVNIHFRRQVHYHNPGARILSAPVHWQFLKWAFHGLVWIVRCYFLEPFHYKISVIHLQDDARATVRPPGKNQAEEENRVNWIGIMKCKKLLVTKDRWLLKKCFWDLLSNLFSQKRAQLRLQQVMYPGGKRVERVTIDERVSGGVTKAGAELSIMRWTLDWIDVLI